MTVHAITAVQLDADSRRVTDVLWGHVSVSGELFEVSPHVAPVVEVVDALSRGDTVVTIFPIDGHRAAGPEVRTVQYEGGQIGIEAVAGADSGRTLAELPRVHYE